MDSIQRLQEQECHMSTGPGGRSRFFGDSLRRSVDMPAYMQWQTLSTDVSIKLRQGSVRINKRLV